MYLFIYQYTAQFTIWTTNVRYRRAAGNYGQNRHNSKASYDAPSINFDDTEHVDVSVADADYPDEFYGNNYGATPQCDGDSVQIESCTLKPCGKKHLDNMYVYISFVNHHFPSLGGWGHFHRFIVGSMSVCVTFVGPQLHFPRSGPFDDTLLWWGESGILSTLVRAANQLLLIS